MTYLRLAQISLSGFSNRRSDLQLRLNPRATDAPGLFTGDPDRSLDPAFAPEDKGRPRICLEEIHIATDWRLEHKPRTASFVFTLWI